MIQLNLLPDVKKEFIAAQKTKALVVTSSIIVTLAAIGLSVLLFIYVTFLQQLQISLATSDIKNKNEQLNNVEDISKYLTIQNQLKALPELHDQKGAYSRLFTFLPVLNPSAPNNVLLSQLQFSTADKTMVLTGTTATFESLNIFVDTLRNAEVTYKQPGSGEPQTTLMLETVGVQTSNLSRVNGKASVAFTVQATYKDVVFDAKNTEISVAIPNIKTSQSVTESPKLFDSSNAGGQ